MVKHHIMILSYIVPPLVMLLHNKKTIMCCLVRKNYGYISAHGHKYESCLGYMNVDYYLLGTGWWICISYIFQLFQSFRS